MLFSIINWDRHPWVGWYRERARPKETPGRHTDLSLHTYMELKRVAQDTQL